MQRFLFILVPVLTGFTAFSQVQIGYNYSLAIPQGKLDKNINLTHSAAIDVSYRFKNVPKLRTGIQLGWGTYAQKKEDQHYEFSDGSSTDVKVTFSSNVFNGHLVTSYELMSKTSVIPYITAKAGISKFYTKIFIPDPEDTDGCRPLENKNMFKDATWSAGGGAGARMNANKIFRKSQCDRLWLDVSMNYLMGGDVAYLNVKHLQHPDASDQDAKDFNVKFVNVTTNELHEHHVSKVLRSRISQLEMKLGLILSLH